MKKSLFYCVLVMVIILVGCARKQVNGTTSRLYYPEHCYPELCYSEQKAHEVYKTYLQCLREMGQSSDSTTLNNDALSSAKWRLTYGMYDETCVESILLLAEYECYDFLQLKWWRSESSEERLFILMCFYHRLNPNLSYFPRFRFYSQRFDKKECDSRLKEIDFAEKVWPHCDDRKAECQ